MEADELRSKVEETGLKKVLMILVSVIAVLAAVSVIGQGSFGGDSGSSSAEWRQIELKDVASGETYSISELEKPVLVETFAVWCSTCTNQQLEVKELHENSGVNSVSLNVDRNEDEEKIREHINRYGFKWRYSIAPTNLTRSLVRQHGKSMLSPPLAPMVLVCEEGSRRLPNGVKSASKLQEEIDKGCKTSN